MVWARNRVAPMDTASAHFMRGASVDTVSITASAPPRPLMETRHQVGG